jgi:hypothetical protein
MICSRCRAEHGSYVRRVIGVCVRQIHSHKGVPASRFYHASELVTVGHDKLCDVCRSEQARHVREDAR